MITGCKRGVMNAVVLCQLVLLMVSAHSTSGITKTQTRRAVITKTQTRRDAQS